MNNTPWRTYKDLEPLKGPMFGTSGLLISERTLNNLYAGRRYEDYEGREYLDNTKVNKADPSQRLVRGSCTEDIRHTI